MDYDVIIIGGGPAGLSAGLYVSRGNYRALLLEKESFGGRIKNVEWIENYPGFAKGVSGPQLASEMVDQATNAGLEIEMAEVTGIELYSGCRCVQLEDGRSYTADALIVAGGCRHKHLGVPGERELAGKGVIECAFCDGGQFSEKVVAVCGGGDSGITEALYLTKLASKVILLEAEPNLTATAVLQERARANKKIEIHCGTKVIAIQGSGHVEALEFEKIATKARGSWPVDGVLVHIGMEPNTGFVEGILSLDGRQQVEVNHRLETSVPFIYAVGDTRSNSPMQVASAVGDGATAAVYVHRLLGK